MIPTVFVCGEGPSDFGNETQKGPLYYIIWRILQNYYSPDIIEYAHVQVVPKGHLKSFRKTVLRENPRGTMLLTGDLEIAATAQILGLFTLKNNGHIAVLHSDVDLTNKEIGTRDKRLRRRKIEVHSEAIRQSIKKGFHASRIGNQGVPLVTIPRSEGWLICLIPENTLSPQAIESLPCNDNAPNGAKDILRSHGYTSIEKKNDLVIDQYTPDKIRLNSHNIFIADMKQALENAN